MGLSITQKITLQCLEYAVILFSKFTCNRYMLLKKSIYGFGSICKTWWRCFGMVHFIMDDHKDFQGPGDGQGCICVIIIMVHLLHVHMLEIVQLMCCIWLSAHCVCIPKTFQLLAIRTLSKFVAPFFVMYSLKLIFLIALNFENEIGTIPAFSPIAFTLSGREGSTLGKHWAFGCN